MSGISASPPSFSPPQKQMKTSRYCSSSSSSLVVPCLCPQQNPRYFSVLKLQNLGRRGEFARLRVHCSSSSRPEGPGSGESDSRGVLDAFFLGKALAEAINERIESTVGELLSAVGRLQAEQQKQVQDFQEDVLERAKRAKEKAAREAMEVQGLIPKSTTVTTSAANDGVTPVVSPSAVTDVTPEISPSSSDPTTATNSDPSNKDPLLGMLNDD